MAMDYGDSAAPNPAGKMGYYAIQAVTNTRTQALSAGLTGAKYGVIPMIGINDVMSEVRAWSREWSHHETAALREPCLFLAAHCIKPYF